MIGGWLARIVPSSGIVTAAPRQQLEQERLEVVVGAVDLVDQQHRRARAGMLERAQQRPADQIVGTEQLVLVQRLPAGLGEPDAEQLPGIVPLVQSLRRVDSLVALQPDQRTYRARPPATAPPRSCRRRPHPRAAGAAAAGGSGTSMSPGPRRRDSRPTRAGGPASRRPARAGGSRRPRWPSGRADWARLI